MLLFSIHLFVKIRNIIIDFSRYGLEANEAKIADMLNQLDLWVVKEEYMNVANRNGICRKIFFLSFRKQRENLCTSWVI